MTKTPLFAAIALCTALITGFATSAQAQTSRLYLAGYLGLNLFGDQEFKDTSTGNSGNFELSNAESFAGALGMRLSHQMRLEAEFSYRKADISDANIAGAGIFATGDHVKSTMLFANAYYDFDVPWVVQPYIGGGLGYAWHEGQISDSSGLISSTSSEASSFVWNAAAGVKYRPKTDMAFTAGYRYIDAFTNLELGSYEIDYSSHEFRLGMEWDLPIR